MSLKANFHTHSTLCDGTSTLRENIETAIALGFSHLGFSGHMDADVHMDFGKYLKDVKKLQGEYKDRIEVLCGVELDNLYSPGYADRVDFVIGSTHFLDVDYERPLSVDDTPGDVVLLCNEFYDGDYYKFCKAYFELESEIYKKFPCSFIGHFDLITKFNNILHFVDENDPKYLNPGYDALETLVKEGIPFEINTRQADRGKFFPNYAFLRRIQELNGEIIISSDAHNARELNKGFDEAVELARNCGFDHTNILSMKSGKLEMIQVGI